MEILFRAKDKLTGEWLEGFVLNKDKTRFGHYEDGFDFALFYCIPETVGQYTGLTDKNGKKIFEGDIVRVTVLSDYPCCVVFDNYGWVFVPVDKMVKAVQFGTLKHAIYEIIGNKWDNPELLGKQDNE